MTIENEIEQIAQEELLPNDGATEVEQEEPTEEEASEEQSADETGEGDEAPKKNGLQTRFDELTKARRIAEEENRALKKILFETAQGKTEPVQQQQVKPEKLVKPDIDTFDGTHEEFMAELVEFHIQERFESEKQKEQAKKVEQEQKVKVDNVLVKLKTFMDKVPDANEKFNQLGEELLPYLADTEKPAELAYYFATHPEVLQSLYGKPPHAVAYQIGKIEASLSIPQKKALPLTAPLKTLSGGSVSTMTKKDPEKMSMEEYAAYRKAN